MTKIAQFHEHLLNAFEESNKKILNRIYGKVNGDTLEVVVRRDHEGLRNCINATILTIHPSDEKHHLELEEVVVGYDEEGSRWSDHMGGRIIDCTGMNVRGAIDAIVAEMNERI